MQAIISLRTEEVKVRKMINIQLLLEKSFVTCLFLQTKDFAQQCGSLSAGIAEVKSEEMKTVVAT
jgi:hypothetical protein